MERDLKKSPWIDEENLNFLRVSLGSTRWTHQSFPFSSPSLSSFSLFFLLSLSFPDLLRPLRVITQKHLSLVSQKGMRWLKNPILPFEPTPFFFKLFEGPVDRYLYVWSTGCPNFHFLENSSRLAPFYFFFACLPRSGRPNHNNRAPERPKI